MQTKELGLSAEAKRAILTELPAVEAALNRMAPSFNRKTTACPTCSLHTAESWSDHQAYETLKAILNRVEKLQRLALASSG
jgi:hypothetical protein